MVDVECPYCDNVVALKKAKSGQGFPYLRCHKCNVLIWFYGGVHNPSKKTVEKEEGIKLPLF